jgi:hypothetical protein
MNLNRLRNIQVSSGSQEATYDAAEAVDSLIKVDAGSIVMEKSQVDDERDLISGLEEPEDQEQLAKHVEVALSQSKCRPHTLAHIAGYALGACVSSLAGTLPYKHTFTPELTLASLPSFTLEGKLKTGLQKKYTGCFVDSFQLSVNRGADRRLAVTSQVYGSGTVASGTATESEVSESAMNAKAASVWLGATTYAGTIGDGLDITTSNLSGGSAVKADLMSFNWDYSNGVDLDYLYEIGGGVVLNSVSRVAREQTISMVLLMDNYTEIDRLNDQDSCAFELMVRGSEIESGRYYGMDLVFPVIKYKVADIQEQDGRLVVSIEATVLQDSTYGSVVLVVVNQQTSYMGA